MKFISESLEDILKPKTKKEILSYFTPLFLDIYEKAKKKYDLAILNPDNKIEPCLSKYDHGKGYVFIFQEGYYIFQVLSNNLSLMIFKFDEYGTSEKVKKLSNFDHLEKIVNQYKNMSESIKDILRPKSKQDIDKEINIIIKNFVNRISIAEFEEYILDNYPLTKIFTNDEDFVISTTKGEIVNAIWFFANEVIGEDPGNYRSRFPEILKIFDYNEKNEGRFMDNICDAFAKKFHLEW